MSAHTHLRSALTDLAASLDASRDASGAYSTHSGPSALAPLDPAQLKVSVAGIWETTPTPSATLLRSVLDLVGRDVAVRPVVDGSLPEPEADAEMARFQTQLQDRLDVVLTLYEVVGEAHSDMPALEPGAVFIPLLEEFVELLSVSTWHTLFSYMETRAQRFCRNMPASKGKALPLLRTINAFLRFLSHTPQDLKLRGRVQLFASSAISVSDKSAINVRGEYAVINTTWEGDEEKEEEKGEKEKAEGDGDGDVAMEDGGELSRLDFRSHPDKQPDFYSTLWSLQKYFAYPPSLGAPAADGGETPFAQFRTKSDFVLARLFEQTKRERVLRGKKTTAPRKRTRESDDLSYPRYLTARSLLEHEIADQQFRRQILLQYFILFQFLLNLTPATANKQQFTGGMPKSFVIDGEDHSWVISTVQGIREELGRMEPDGPRFEETVVQLMNRERRYATWKNDGCPESEWDILPVSPTLASSTAEKWKRQCRPMRRWPYKLGTPSVTRVWETGYKGMGDWRRPADKDVFELEEELRRVEADEEDERAMGREVGPEVNEQKRTIRWCALRAARKSHPRIVAALKVYDLHELVRLIREAENKRLGVPVASEAEGEAEVEEADAEEADAEGEAEGEAAGEEAEGEAAEAAGTPAATEAADAEVKLASLPDEDEAAAPDGDVAMADASEPADPETAEAVEAPAAPEDLASPEKPASEGLGEAE